MDKEYNQLTYNENRLEFAFIVKGRNGAEYKSAKFSKMEHFNAYNLALGTVREDGSVNYSAITNNGDLIRLFSTVIHCISLFFEKYPDKNVFFTGDTDQKTKVYQEVLRRHYQGFSERFHIFGVVENEYDVTLERFESSKQYSAFIIKNKLDAE